MSDMPVADEDATSSGGDAKARPERPDHRPPRERAGPPPAIEPAGPAQQPGSAGPSSTPRVPGEPTRPNNRNNPSNPSNPSNRPGPSEHPDRPTPPADAGAPDAARDPTAPAPPAFEPALPSPSATTRTAPAPTDPTRTDTDAPHPVEPPTHTDGYGPLPSTEPFGADRPNTRGRRPRLLAGLAALAVIVVVALLLGHGNIGDLLDQADRSAAPAARQDAGGEASASKNKPRVTRIETADLAAIAADRTRALKAGDIEAFLAGIDPAQPTLVADQRRLFANLRLFPFGSAEFRPATDPVEPGTDTGPLTREVSVVFAHQLTGVDSEPVAEEYRWTVTRASVDAPLLIGRIAGGRLRGGNTYPAPWDEGELAVIERPHVLLAVPTKNKAKAQTWADRAETAVKKDLAVWKGPDITPRRFVLYVTPDRETFERALAGSNLPNVEGVCRSFPPARPTGRAEPMAGSRITLDGSRELFTPGDARQQGHLIRHEVGHAMVAEFERGVGGPPLWVSEGFAEYLAWTEYSLAQWHQPEARRQVDAGKFTGTLPTDAEINSPDEQTAAVGYHYGMLAIRYIAEKYGVAKADAFVVAVYQDATRIDEALRTATGLDRNTFEANWAKYVKAKVGS
jgi:hypothetical protein